MGGGGGGGSAPIEKNWRYTLKTPQEMAQQSLQKNANFGQAITLGSEDYNREVEKYTSKYQSVEQQKQEQIKAEREAAEIARKKNKHSYDEGSSYNRDGNTVDKYATSYVVDSNKSYGNGKNPASNNFYQQNLGADWFKKEAVSAGSQSDAKLANRKNAITDQVEMKGADDIEISDNTSKTRAGIKGSATKQAVGTNKSINPSKTGLKL